MLKNLRAQAKQLSVDPNRIGVWGQSAGAHLAALLGASGGAKRLEGNGGWRRFSSRVQAVVAWNPPVDFLKIDSALRATKPEDDAIFRLLGGPLLSHKEQAIAANPITYVTRDDPPFLIMHGDKDRTVGLEQSRSLYEALKGAGVNAECDILEGEGHFGVSNNPPGVVSGGLEANRTRIRDRMDVFFDSYLKRTGG